jgi:hypothetical protein
MKEKKGVVRMLLLTAAADLYHLYRDYTFFEYQVVLTRDDEEAGIQGERYVLTVSEMSSPLSFAAEHFAPMFPCFPPLRAPKGDLAGFIPSEVLAVSLPGSLTT